MRPLFVFIIQMIWLNSWGQSEGVISSEINIERTGKYLVKENLQILEYSAPLVGFQKFNVKFIKAELSSSSKTVTIYGRVCIGQGTLDCVGITGVEIFKAKRTKRNRLKAIRNIAESSYDKNSFEKIGYFNFKIRLKVGERLYFFAKNFFLEEFKIAPK